MRLPRLPLNYKNHPELLERYWDKTMTSIESLFDQILAVPVIQEFVNQLKDATAEATAVIASTKAETSLLNSFVQSAGAVLSADAAGAVTVVTHTRVYGDTTLNPSVTVNGAVLATGAAPASMVRVFYSDPSRTGGTVAYQFTVDPAPTAAQSGTNHSVGAVIIPGAGSANGVGLAPPGYIYL
jgi:hypothetical protein